MSKNLLRALCAVAVLVLPGVAAAQKKPADIPVETFFRRAEFTNMQLSPDGARLAAVVPLKGRGNLVVIDLASKARKVITDFASLDVGNFYWVNNNRLCLQVADGQDVSGEFNYRGTYCIDHDGDSIRNFTKLGVSDASSTQDGYRTITPLAQVHDGSGEIIARMTLRSRYSWDVYRFNTLTGRYQLLTPDSPGDVTRWVLDRNNVPRIAVSQPEIRSSSQTSVRTVWYRDGADAKWEKLHETEIVGLLELKGSFIPLAFDYDNSTLYVSSNQGGDKNAIYRYDTKARKLGEMLVRHPMIDLDDPTALVFSHTQKKLVGVRYDAEMPSVAWLDPAIERLQKSIDAAMSATVNTISLPSETDERALVYARSDVDPGGYYLLDRKKPSVELLAKTREWLDPALMAQRRFIKYKARDGLEIPAWVTIPKGGGKNLPLIVNIHGGPWARSYSGIEWGRPEAQFFASRGYVVLEPEPRGSTGFGRKHYASAFKQWGQAMQDDITDGALHLVNEGLVDKDRMCLHGGSYGGYAAAMGLVKDPDLWKCGSPFVAVTDLFLFQNVPYSDISYASYFFQTDFKKVVGDSDADREMFRKYSPALQADKVKAAVLLTMGSNDVRVPQVHGDSFASALENAGKNVEYVIYKGEGHGYNKDENVFDFYRRLEKFFARHLKP
jgi:dipeptidyl aminopeptidase/acylaminoacyl peptidase